MALLSEAQRRQFEEAGYLLLREAVPRAALRGVIKSIERAVDNRAQNLRREGLRHSSLHSLSFIGQ